MIDLEQLAASVRTADDADELAAMAEALAAELDLDGTGAAVVARLEGFAFGLRVGLAVGARSGGDG